MLFSSMKTNSVLPNVKTYVVKNNDIFPLESKTGYGTPVRFYSEHRTVRKSKIILNKETFILYQKNILSFK